MGRRGALGEGKGKGDNVVVRVGHQGDEEVKLANLDEEENKAEGDFDVRCIRTNMEGWRDGWMVGLRPL